MAKDDYNVIVYKILLYFYAILKRKISFRDETFQAAISKADIQDEYLTDVLQMMNDENLITGVRTVKAWGNERIMISKKSNISITAQGIRYLEENSKMKKIGEQLTSIPGLISSLIDIVKPF